MRLNTTYCGLLFLLVFAPAALEAQQTQTQPESAQASRLDNALSAIYVAQSESALSQSDVKTAGDLLRVALEFDPANSDAHYLQGELYRKIGGKIPDAIKSYEAALNAGAFSSFSESECRLKLAPLLLRTKQYARAADILRGLGISSASYYLEYARALAGMGRTYQARNLLEAATSAFPGDSQIISLRVQLDPAFRAELARNYLSATRASSPEKGALASLISNTTDPATKSDLVALYDKLFGFSSEVYAQSMMVASSVTTAEIDRYVASGLLADGALTKQLYSALPAGAARSYLASKVAAYSGTVSLDTNGDGIAEETAEYRNGRLVSLADDPNQNGVPEYSVTFSSGVPSSVELSVDGSPYALTYGDYPFVATATTESSGNETTYTLDPMRLSFPLFDERSTVPSGPSNFPPLVSVRGSVSPQSLFSFAVQVATKNKSTQTPVSMWKKSINDILTMEKQWESGRYNYKAVFHGGEKYSAEIDMDNDGHYEVHELYRDGKLYKVSYDGDHDGIPGFTLVLQPYPVLSWDFNDDGIADEIEKRINPTTTILEFSTKMNGVFDVVTKEVKK